VRAFGCEPLRRRQADAAIATDDERDLSFELIHRSSLRREAVATACWNLAPATSTRSSWTKATGKVKAASEAAESSLMRYNVGFAAIAVNVSQGCAP